MQYGKFITVEGIEGVGKTTNIEYVRALLQDMGLAVTVTREPGGTPLGEALRDLLLGHQHDGMDDNTELLLMFAARNEHLARVIKPALADGSWVICDRFTDATYAYQGGGRGISPERIEILENWVQHDLRPDLTLLLDLPVATGLKRAGKREQLADRFEAQKQAFFENVRQCYLDRAAAEPGRFHVIDASKTLDQVQTSLRDTLQRFVAQHGERT